MILVSIHYVFLIISQWIIYVNQKSSKYEVVLLERITICRINEYPEVDNSDSIPHP